MTRRVAAGFGRLLPLLLIATAVVIVIGATLVAACGRSSGGESPQPTASAPATEGPLASPAESPSPSPSASAGETTLRVYFLRGDELGVAQRYVPHTVAVAGAAIEALLEGPTSAEKDAGLATALAPGIRLNSLTISGGVARVDVSSRFSDSGGGLDDAHSLLPGAQIVYTLTQFPTVRRVAIRVDDQPYPAAGSADSPATEWRRQDCPDYEPAIFVETPGVGAVISSPFAIAGTASVYEGSFIARLVDTSGRRVVNTPVQASLGAPGRGRFAKEIAFSTSAARGTLIVYEQSMEDGSRRNEVRIPVAFATD